MKPESAIRAILFDVGWTLIYPKPTRKEAMEQCLLALGYTFPTDVLESAYRAAVNFYRVHRWQPQVVANLPQFWQEYYTVYTGHIGIEDPGITAAIHEQASKTVQFHLYPTTLPVLEELRRRGYLLGAVSNWSAELPGILEDLGLMDYLDSLVVSDIVGYHKPQPEIFRNALMSLGIQASEAIHVGDDLEADVEGARRAGIRPIWMKRSVGEDANPVDRIQSLEELLLCL